MAPDARPMHSYSLVANCLYSIVHRHQITLNFQVTLALGSIQLFSKLAQISQIRSREGRTRSHCDFLALRTSSDDLFRYTKLCAPSVPWTLPPWIFVIVTHPLVCMLLYSETILIIIPVQAWTVRLRNEDLRDDPNLVLHK